MDSADADQRNDDPFNVRRVRLKLQQLCMDVQQSTLSTASIEVDDFMLNVTATFQRRNLSLASAREGDRDVRGNAHYAQEGAPCPERDPRYEKLVRRRAQLESL